MVQKIFPTDYTIQPPINTVASYVAYSDSTDSDKTKVSSVESFVAAALPGLTTDILPAGATNLYMTSAEKTKLAGIVPGADVSPVQTVNGTIGNVVLTQDDVGDGITYVRTQNNFSNLASANLGIAYSHSQQITGNPHNVTKSEV